MTAVQDFKFDANGLLTAVVQDAGTGRVLMLAHMNADALQQTIDTKIATFWSRSRSQIWVKGSMSGNMQRVVSMQVDCDRDAVLLQVEATGPACHNGTESCFDSETLTFDASGDNVA